MERDGNRLAGRLTGGPGLAGGPAGVALLLDRVERALATRERVWQLYLTTPPPLGYNPGDFWPAGPNDPAFGLLRLRPTRIDITGLASSPKPKLTWRPSGTAGG